MRGGRLLFQRAAQKILSGQLASHLFNKTQEHWLRGTMAPSSFRRRADALEAQVRRLVAFCASALVDGVLRPLNAPPRRIRDDEDWAEALENLDGFREMLLQIAAIPPKPMTAAERRELARFCAARGVRGAGCHTPCGPARGLLGTARCAVAAGPAAGDAYAMVAAAGAARYERRRAAAKARDDSTPSPRGSAYALTVPRRLPLRDLGFSALRRQADAVGAKLAGRGGRTMSRARATKKHAPSSRATKKKE